MPVADPSVVQVPNPSVASPTSLVESGRIPMSVPTQKLAAPDIPGFHLHWFLGAPDNIHRALRAGYTFVEDHEVGLNNKDLAGGNQAMSGTDLGTRVSVVAGGTYDGSPNEAARLYLMKLPEELWKLDQEALSKRNKAIAAAIRGDGLVAPGADNSNRYRPDQEKLQKKTLFHEKN